MHAPVQIANLDRPVMTYSHQGVAKRGVKKSDHAIIHTGKWAPEATPAEVATSGKDGMLPHAIQVDSDRAEQLHAMSRIDFGKVYTIEHNVKVCNFGRVNPASMSALRTQFGIVWQRTLDSAVIPQWPDNVNTAAIESSTDDMWGDCHKTLTKFGFTDEQARGVLMKRQDELQEDSTGIGINDRDENANEDCGR